MLLYLNRREKEITSSTSQLTEGEVCDIHETRQAYHIQQGFACKCGESASISGSFELLIDRRETIPF